MRNRQDRKRNKEIRKARKTRDKSAANRSLKSDMKLFRQQLGNTLGGYDYTVVILVVLFSIFGVAMVFSAGYYQTINTTHPNPAYYLLRQLFFAVTGWVLMLIFANIDYHIYAKWGTLAIIASIGLLVLVLLVGSSSHNAQRWLSVFGIRITPSELSKLAVIVFTSAFLIDDPDNIRTFKGLSILIGVMGLHFALIVKQPNLSTAIVIALIMIAIMIVGGLNLIYLLFPIAGAVGGYYFIINYRQNSHWYQRLTSFVDPFLDRQGDGYQVTQGLIALGNGGLKGLGFGHSIAKNMYLPEPQNDFILAIIGEELGYIGFLFLMAAYIFLMFRLVMIALKARDRLGFYLATGVAVMLGLQVIINVAVVTSSMPATGITLPFISYGGTSMWSFMMAMGIALNVSKKKENRIRQQIPAERTVRS